GNPVDLNKDAGGGMGSKGEKVVYLGYKTTTDRKEAVTDLALMNMKGGYSVEDYDTLMEGQMKSQIIPFVENFLAAINEYRSNCRSGNSAAKQRATYIRGILNKFIDDDTGKGLGDLLLKKTVYELGMDAYNKLPAADKAKTDAYQESLKVYDSLSESEKKEHADILTILAQSNGNATLMIENLITRAADNTATSWVDRLSEVSSYEDFVEIISDDMGLLPSEAEAELARLYEDDAKKILNMWDDLTDVLNGYSKSLSNIKEYDAGQFEDAITAIENLDESSSGEDITDALVNYDDASGEMLDAMADVQTVACYEFLDSFEYGDGTLLDFFMQPGEDVEEDLTVLYPLVASLTEGQRAGLDFVSLMELIAIAATDPENYSDEKLEEIEEVSIYEGVDREIYKKGGVALTSEALRKDAAEKIAVENGIISGLTIAMISIIGVSVAAIAASAVLWAKSSRALVGINQEISQGISNMNSQMFGQVQFDQADFFRENPAVQRNFNYHTARSSICSKLAIGLSIAVVILTAITTYLAYRDMVNHYKVEFTPVPRYMVDEADITALNENGERIVLKNQTVYYKAVECNRTEKDEFYKTLGTSADRNGDVGKQWLALYAQKSEASAPILADSLLVKVKDTNIPAGYKTGIHMFGSKTAANLNNELYDWNKSAPSIMVYFKTAEATTPGSAGSNFTAGNLALAGVAGLAVGAVITALASKAVGKKKKSAAA
ncbi:MAG: hypothetical protein IKI78_06765, partial [Clostridia bacterium]|nr:hypothetical protein [Clostridia bacterium]